MKINNDICIAFLMASGWMNNHDNEVYKAGYTDCAKDANKRKKNKEIKTDMIFNR